MESLRKELRDLESGIQKKRNEYAKTMEKAKSDGEKEVVRLEKSVKQLSAEKQKKQAEEEKANELFQEKEKLKEERDEEKERKRREEEERQNPSSTPHPNDESKEEREMREMEEEMREIEREGEVDRAGAKIAASESKRREEVEKEENDREETDEERGRRIAEQWVHSDDDDDRRREGRVEEEGGENEEGFIDGDYADPDGHDDHSYDDDDVDYEDDYYPSNGDDEETDEEVEAEATTKKVGMFGRMKRMLVGDKNSKGKTQRTSEEENDKIEDEERALEDARKLRDEASRKASQARDKFEESNNKLSTLKAKIEKLSSVTSDETTKLLVGALFNQCFSTQADKYTYEICLFGQSKQDSHVRLGDMKNDMKNEVVFEDASGKRFVKFENGEKCWNGPKRSMTVELVCGSKEALFDVLEPSRCEYSSKFSTPIACDEKQLEMKKLELERLVARERNAKGERGEEEVEYVVNY